MPTSRGIYQSREEIVSILKDAKAAGFMCECPLGDDQKAKHLDDCEAGTRCALALCAAGSGEDTHGKV